MTSDANHFLSLRPKASFEFEPDYYEDQTDKDPNEVVPEAKYTIKLLYTVLSAHRPNQSDLHSTSGTHLSVSSRKGCLRKNTSGSREL
jgi:hypothetical protein